MAGQEEPLFAQIEVMRKAISRAQSPHEIRSLRGSILELHRVWLKVDAPGAEILLRDYQRLLQALDDQLPPDKPVDDPPS